MTITASAPCRISLFGGGTDCEPFSSQYGGVTVSIAVNLRQHITFFVDEKVQLNTFPENGSPEFLMSIFADEKIKGIVHSSCDAHLGSGLGSSAAAAVAALGVIHRIHPFSSLEEIAERAWLAEQRVGWFGGKQDQYASLSGGCNVFEFHGDVKKTPLSRGFIEPLLPSLLLVYMGKRKKKDPQEGLREPTPRQMGALQKIKEIAVESLDYLVDANYEKVGELLDLSWDMKKISHPFSTNHTIDDLYEVAKKHGAYGGKVCGSGSGGYMFFIVHPAERKRCVEALKKKGAEEVDFSIDWNGLETRIL